MTKEKVLSLQNYLEKMKQKLSDPVPQKHAHGEKEYREFLVREISMTKKKLELAL